MIAIVLPLSIHEAVEGATDINAHNNNRMTGMFVQTNNTMFHHTDTTMMPILYIIKYEYE